MSVAARVSEEMGTKLGNEVSSVMYTVEAFLGGPPNHI